MVEDFETMYRNEIINRGSRVVSTDAKEQCKVLYVYITKKYESFSNTVSSIDRGINELCEEVINIRTKLNEQMDESEVDNVLDDIDMIISSISDSMDSIHE